MEGLRRGSGVLPPSGVLMLGPCSTAKVHAVQRKRVQYSTDTITIQQFCLWGSGDSSPVQQSGSYRICSAASCCLLSVRNRYYLL